MSNCEKCGQEIKTRHQYVMPDLFDDFLNGIPVWRRKYRSISYYSSKIGCHSIVSGVLLTSQNVFIHCNADLLGQTDCHGRLK